MGASLQARPAGEARIRAFLALPVPEETRERLAALVRELGPQLPGLRAARPEAIHLTLRFLGPTSREQITVLQERLPAAAAACPRGRARVSGLGLFPPRGAPHVLWIGVQLPAPMQDLPRACEAAAVAAGFAPEARPFRPHLTLGRFKGRAPRPSTLPPADLGEMPIEELILFRSELHPAAAVHTPVARFPLAC